MQHAVREHSFAIAGQHCERRPGGHQLQVYGNGCSVVDPVAIGRQDSRFPSYMAGPIVTWVSSEDDSDV